MIFCKKTNVRSFQYYGEICRHIFYLLEYSEFFFMFRFNWITTPLGDGGREVLYHMLPGIFFLVLFFVAVNYVEGF